MYLFLVRHGEANPDSPDEQRQLSPKGVAEVTQLAQTLKEAKISLELIYHSNKLRAKQTAEILKNHINPKAKLVMKGYLSPNGSTDRMLGDIAQLNCPCMIVGHLPFLSHLVSRLIVGEEAKRCVAFLTGSMVMLEKDQNGQWVIISMINPQFL